MKGRLKDRVGVDAAGNGQSTGGPGQQHFTGFCLRAGDPLTQHVTEDDRRVPRRVRGK